MSLVLHAASTEMQGVLINFSGAVCSAYKSRNFNKLLLVYCKLIMYHIKIIPVVYSKLFLFGVPLILLCCISYHSYCTK